MQEKNDTDELLLRLLEQKNSIVKIIVIISKSYTNILYINVLEVIIKQQDLKSLLFTVWLINKVITAVLDIHVVSQSDIQLIDSIILAFHFSTHTDPSTHVSVHVQEDVNIILFSVNINQCH